MRKSLLTLGAALLLSTQAFATYYVVLKDGTQYRAKAKWTIVNGKAIVALENGQSLQLDPNAIDVAKSEEATKFGGGTVLAQQQAQAAPSKQAPSTLGGAFKLRKLPGDQTTTNAPAPVAPITGPVVSNEVLTKFETAFENVGIFEHTLVGTGAHALRADLTVDSEEKVFNALTATALLIMHNAGVPGAQIDMVELFMKTTVGQAAGRFQISRADAQVLDSKSMTPQEYFVRKVIY
ncbi:MAG: hypothetical protein M3041_09755 [Acidobacteriota bacterium]|nr:hypothetical protein [Acidobacteriota bacterium]